MLETTRSRRAAALLGATTALIVAAALPAAAHVAVSPPTALQGSSEELTFRVPNEEASATTSGLQLQIPTDHPIAQVLPKAAVGWTVSVKTVTLAKPLVTDDGTFTTAVSEIDWTGGTIPLGQYQDFQISVDPLPKDTDQVVFKAVQTYSNGDVVRWIDVPITGQPAPDHPAPVLTLTKTSGSASRSSTGTTATAANSTQPDSDGAASTALWLGGIGLATALAALVLSLLSRRRTG